MTGKVSTREACTSKNMDDPKCRGAWEMYGGLEGIGSLRVAESWLSIMNVENMDAPNCRGAWEM